ncbi:MAG: hypothetical protein HYX23_00080 [Candidatus Zambryskibacteria bacterium]|nr:hypothetical protein [Candidatus Zambryskibacteria bacterium]
MKIVSSGRVINSAGFYQKKKKRRRIKFALVLIGVLTIVFTLIYLSRLEKFLITAVMITGENVADREEMTQAVQSLIDNHYLWMIPRANAFIYPRRAIKQSLIEKFPRLRSVDLNLDKFQTLVINVEERMPFALYCIEDECFFVDKGGFIFAPAPSFSNGVYFVYSTEEPIGNPIGKQLIPAENFESLLGFIKILPTLNLQPTAMKITADDYNLLLPNGGQLIWRRGDDPVLLHSNLEAFLSDDSIKAQKDFLKKVLYLDLRTTNKVFYKFK